MNRLRPILRRRQAHLPAAMLFPILFLLPFCLSWWWSEGLHDSAYLLLRQARNLATERGLGFDLAAGGAVAPVYTPLFLALLTALEGIGLPAARGAWFLSAMGWSVTGLALLGIGRALNRPLAGAIAAGLLVVSPVVVAGLGTPLSWTGAWLCLALWFGLSRRWTAQNMAILLLWLTTLSSAALLPGLLLGLQQGVWRRKIPWLALGVVAAGGVVWAGIGRWRPAYQGPLIAPDPLAGWRHLGQLASENPFYGLALLTLAIGVIAMASALWSGRPAGDWRPAPILWPGLISFVLALAGGELLGLASIAILAYWLVGLGGQWLVDRMERGGRFRVSGRSVQVGFAVIWIMPLLLAQLTSLADRYVARPVPRWNVEAAAAGWIQANSDPTDTVLASARLSYLADRPLAASEGSDRLPIGRLPEWLLAQPPDLVVSPRSLPWGYLTGTGWFQERYRPARRFTSAYDAQSPLTAWTYHQSNFDAGTAQTIDVATPAGFDLIAYQYSPETLRPGQALYVTLQLRATAPVTNTFHTIVRLIGTADGRAYAQQDRPTPLSLPVAWWAPGQVIPERFVLTTTEEIPVGSYQVNLSWRSPLQTELWPLRRGADPNPLDRVTLGYVAVPWPGEATGTPSGARFGEQIQLTSYELAGEPTPGGQMALTLFWEALRPPDDDYVVLVHLLDVGGQLVANGDGPPYGGGYTTLAWRPGDTIPDVHLLNLPADLPPGTYTLQVGFYRADTGERLPVQDAAGTPQPDGTLLLESIRLEP